MTTKQRYFVQCYNDETLSPEDPDRIIEITDSVLSSDSYLRKGENFIPYGDLTLVVDMAKFPQELIDKLTCHLSVIIIPDGYPNLSPVEVFTLFYFAPGAAQEVTKPMIKLKMHGAWQYQFVGSHDEYCAFVDLYPAIERLLKGI